MMKSFIFDMYGYYSKDEGHEFDLNGWHFCLESIKDLTESEVASLDEFVVALSSNFQNAGVKIIKNRNQTYISRDDKGEVVLVAYKIKDFPIQDLIKMHHIYEGIESKEPYKISYLIALWEEKVNSIKEKIIPSLKMDDYFYYKIMVSVINSIGLANNAIQYLAELKIDFDDEIIPLTLTHRRIKDLSTSSLFDPLNFVLDSPVRDLAEIYKEKIITSKELINLLGQYKIDVKQASLLLARILFPTTIFDLLEEHYLYRNDVKNKIMRYYHDLKEYIKEIKYIEKELVRRYGIRPITWLEK